jgi:hypothetical protein
MSLARLAAVFLALAVVLACAPAARAQGATPAPCASGTPSALQLSGLPSRIRFGARRHFSLVPDDPTWAVVGSMDVQIRGEGGKLLFERKAASTPATFPLRLALGERRAKVTATFTQTDGSGASCLRTISARVRGFRRFGAIARCDRPRFRPRSILIACGDGNFGLTKLRWRGWNRRTARARGKAFANDCLPDCASGHFHRYAVWVRAYRVRLLGGTYAYTRLRIAYVNRRPASSRRVIVEKAGHSGGQFFWR